jgi:hypothetical protein
MPARFARALLLCCGALGLSLMSASATAVAQEAAGEVDPQRVEDADAGQSTEAPRSPDPANAATWYLQAAAKRRALQHTDQQEDAVARFDGDPSRGPSTQVQQILRRYAPVVLLARRAARREACDFAFGISPASPDYLTRLGEGRSITRILRLEFQQRVFNNDVQGATDLIVVHLRMASHFAHEDTMIGSTLSSAMLALVDSLNQTALDHAIIGPADAATLLREMDRFDAEDPARYRVAARTELADRVQPLLATFAGEGGVERLREHLRAISPHQTLQEIAALEALTQERLDDLLVEAAAVTQTTLDMLAERDPAKALASFATLQKEVADGRLGPLDNLIGYQVKSLDLMQRARKILADRRAVIAGIADGSIEPMSLANAAVWCIRATLQMENIDPAKVQAINVYAAKHDQSADPTLTAIFNRFDVQSVLDTLRAATSIERCDFSYANWSAAVTHSSYHAGMLACGRLLVADAARLFHEQRYFESAERLAIAYRLSGRLAGDGTIAGSLAAHRIFADADALAEAALDSRMLADEHIALLAAAVDSISRGDPFHYQPAIASLRRTFEPGMTYFVQGMPRDLPPPTAEQIEQAEAILAGLSPDRLLSFAAVCEFWERATYWPGRTDPALSAAGLDAIYDMSAFQACAEVAPYLTEWSRGRVMENVLDGGAVSFPVIAPLEQRARQSIVDYRRCVTRMDRLLREQGGIGTAAEKASHSSSD